MNTLQTVVGVILIIALLYVAFIVGAVILRVLVGLVAIIIAGFLLRRLFVGQRTGRSP
jgi:uncharacterized membrane protein YraQ (UPF0718 family)